MPIVLRARTGRRRLLGLKNSAIHGNPFSRDENNTNAGTRYRRLYIEFPELARMCA